MIGEVVMMQNEEGKPVFGLLVNVENESVNDGKMFIPCNQLLWETKNRELKTRALLNKKVEIRFIQE